MAPPVVFLSLSAISCQPSPLHSDMEESLLWPWDQKKMGKKVYYTWGSANRALLNLYTVWIKRLSVQQKHFSKLRPEYLSLRSKFHRIKVTEDHNDHNRWKVSAYFSCPASAELQGCVVFLSCISLKSSLPVFLLSYFFFFSLCKKNTTVVWNQS